MVFSPPSIVKDALGDSGVLMNPDLMHDGSLSAFGDDQQQQQQQSSQVVDPLHAPGAQHNSKHSTANTVTITTQSNAQHNAFATTAYGLSNNERANGPFYEAQSYQNNATKTPILNTILLKSKAQPKYQHQQHVSNTFNPFADENDAPSYNFQLSKTIWPTKSQSAQNNADGNFGCNNAYNNANADHAGTAFATSTPTQTVRNEALAQSQSQPPFTRTFGFNRTNLMWQSVGPSSGATANASSAFGGSANHVAGSNFGCEPLGGGGSNVSRFQIRSVSAEHLCSSSPNDPNGGGGGGSTSNVGHSATAFRPLLPLQTKQQRSDCSPFVAASPFVADENSCSSSSNYVDDPMTFKSYDLNDEYWLNFDQ